MSPLTIGRTIPPPKKKVFIEPKHQFFKGGQTCRSFQGEFRTSSMPKHQTRQESRNVFGRSKADQNDFFHSWPWCEFLAGCSSSSLCFASNFFLRIKVETPLPSRELTYPTEREKENRLKSAGLVWDMLISRRVANHHTQNRFKFQIQKKTGNP